jgi:hypothetical protein
LTVLKADNARNFESAVQTALKETEKPMVIHAVIQPGNIPTAFINDDPAVLAHQFRQFINAEAEIRKES